MKIKKQTHKGLIEANTFVSGVANHHYIDYRIQPNLSTGLFGNIDFFSEKGVTGWAIDFSAPALPLELELLLNDHVIGEGATQFARPDVENLAKVEGKFGFQINWDWSSLAKAIASYKNDDHPPIQVIVKSESRPILPPLGPTALEIRKWIKTNSLSKIVGLSLFRGNLEGAFFCSKTNSTILFGWMISSRNAEIWAEDQENNCYSIEICHEWFRPDVYETFEKNITADIQFKGFIGAIESPNLTERISLRVMTKAGPLTISEINPSILPEHPIAAARVLFDIQTPHHEFSTRVQKFDIHFLRALQERNNKALSELPINVQSVGSSKSEPVVSLIIPLYGRFDFVEHQLIEFARDAWLQQHVQIIYVVDDPRIVSDFGAHVHRLYRLYKIPFQWVWGGANRGFSGANNLGATIAKGNHLLFMNSDVFPQDSGWLEALVDNLSKEASLGAVSPRLVFADGSIQHAGMEYVYCDELRIWINHHPNMGLDPSLDPIKELTKVPAITGACLLMRRKDFDLIGGWDESYLIGDFEDSDLCMKLRAKGLDVAYNPSVQLTHLERQSFSQLGHNAFRDRIMQYNAVRFQTLWQSEVENVAEFSMAANHE